MEIVTGEGDITASNEAKEDWKEKRTISEIWTNKRI